ncbi:MAG: hypothetical protein HYR64_04815 [Fimbriimonas ginsengisoli]|uniref:Uncharacterized protein n=1 Tax=Fimbriimonas ginsengisoli TaxID=1005039 RepID=A0A931LS26_FIMGI|nr:hypothetical protein [Fimbriimonas ginsengisoli]
MPSELPITAYRGLCAYCWAWGAVAAYREAGGVGYPSLAEIHGQRYRPIGGQGITAMGAAFSDVERTLRGEPPLMRGVLFFQYARPQVHESAPRSLHDYVDHVFGERLPVRDRERVVGVVRKVRREWARRAAYQLFGPSADTRQDASKMGGKR